MVVDENNMFIIMKDIHKVLSDAEELGYLSLDEWIGLKRVLDVAADMWFDPDS